MKPIDNRQNKLMQLKAGKKHVSPTPSAVSGLSQEGTPSTAGPKGGAVFGLISNLLFASKIAQSAKHSHSGVHNFDKADALLEHAKAKPPFLVILDWDGCEAEAFKLLKVFQRDEAFKKIPTVGYLSHVQAATVFTRRQNLRKCWMISWSGTLNDFSSWI